MGDVNYELCIAIDFGTTYSGAAFSYHSQREKTHIVSNWSDGTTGSKIPTAILFDDKQKFVAFGKDAVNQFTQIQKEEKARDFFYFHKFKMNLYREKV